jgi:hypothetical protein
MAVLKIIHCATFLRPCYSLALTNFLQLPPVAMTVDPGSVPKGAIPTLDDDFENEVEAVDRYVPI